MKSLFNVNEVVKGKNNSFTCIGKIESIERSGNETIYMVNDDIHITPFKEYELVKVARPLLTPTESEMRLIKSEIPCLKKGNVEVGYARATMFTFKAKVGTDIFYGQFIGDTFKKITKERFEYYLTYNM